MTNQHPEAAFAGWLMAQLDGQPLTDLGSALTPIQTPEPDPNDPATAFANFVSGALAKKNARALPMTQHTDTEGA